MIEVRNLTKKFGNTVVLDDVSLTVSNGERVIITGQNGAGKTTLVRLILGEYLPNSGSVTIDGISPLSRRAKALLGVAFVPQLPPPLRLTVTELLEYASSLAEFETKSAIALCDKLSFHLTPHKDKMFYKLSGGMKQKILISIALAGNASTLIFDEPTANLDREGRAEFFSLLRALPPERSLIFICHRAEDMAGIITREIKMEMGRIVERPSPHKGSLPTDN